MNKPRVRFGRAVFALRPTVAATRLTLYRRARGSLLVYLQLGLIHV